MFFLSIILIAAVAGTLVLRKQHPSPKWTLLLLAEVLLAVGLVSRQATPVDLAEPYEVVFEAGGYGLGELLTRGPDSGPVLVLLPGEGRIDTLRVKGLKRALPGGRFDVTTATVPVHQETGHFVAEELARATAGFTGVVVAFAGPGRKPADAAWKALLVCHPHSTDGMSDWWKSGILKAVAAPLGGVPEPPRGAGHAEVFGSHYTVRTEG